MMVPDADSISSLHYNQIVEVKGEPEAAAQRNVGNGLPLIYTVTAFGASQVLVEQPCLPSGAAKSLL